MVMNFTFRCSRQGLTFWIWLRRVSNLSVLLQNLIYTDEYRFLIGLYSLFILFFSCLIYNYLCIDVITIIVVLLSILAHFKGKHLGLIVRLLIGDLLFDEIIIGVQLQCIRYQILYLLQVVVLWLWLVIFLYHWGIYFQGILFLQLMFQDVLIVNFMMMVGLRQLNRLHKVTSWGLIILLIIRLFLNNMMIFFWQKFNFSLCFLVILCFLLVFIGWIYLSQYLQIGLFLQMFLTIFQILLWILISIIRLRRTYFMLLLWRLYLLLIQLITNLIKNGCLIKDLCNICLYWRIRILKNH